MNEYLFSEIKLGIKHSFTVEINKDMMQKFLDISGDNNPMHLDVTYAKSKGMKSVCS